MEGAIGLVLGIVRLALQKALNFRYCGKAPIRIAFKRFLHDGGNRLIAHKDFPAAFSLDVFIAPRCAARPKPFFEPCLGFLIGLAAILLTLKLRLGGKHGFGKAAFGCVLGLEVEEVNQRAA
ncbi:MAG: hypothetical protein AAFX04_13275 [Pseudomonadota bacterium]